MQNAVIYARLVALLLAAASSSCSPKPGAGSTSAESSSEDALAQQAYAQWQADAADWDRNEAQRQQTCAALDVQQVDLNNTYQQIKHDSPATSEIVISSIQQASERDLNDEDKEAILASCFLVAAGGGDCGKTYNDIRLMKEKQRLLNGEVQRACCPVNTSEDVYADIGMSFKPECTVSPRPKPPESFRR